MPEVSVIICTWNRAALLDRTLHEMRAMHVPDGLDWELLVVNNNCSDNTDEVIARHVEALPIRRLFQSEPGLSNARNCAIDNSQSELLIWTDDDVLVNPQWLAAMVSASRNFPEAVYFGGPILPWYEASPPAWLSKNIQWLSGMFAGRELGDEERPFRPEVAGDIPYGANMAFRRCVFDGFRFDAKLGRIGGGMLSGEETVLVKLLRQRGAAGVWVASAAVRHFIPRDRMTLAYVRKFFEGLGRTSVRTEGVPEMALWLGAPRKWYRLCIQRWFDAMRERLAGRTTWIKNYTRSAEYLGKIREARSMARSKRSAALSRDDVPAKASSN